LALYALRCQNFAILVFFGGENLTILPIKAKNG